jgi:ribosomal protein S18 acetylase RimI-like enzyme
VAARGREARTDEGFSAVPTSGPTASVNGVEIEIRRLGAGDSEAVLAASSLFDDSPDPAATRRFLAEPNHHLLVAYRSAERPVGFVSGVELTHPDKGTEMFLYELGVDPAARRRGVGRALVEALAALAEERGCYGMWVLTDADNVAAQKTYRRAGSGGSSAQMMFEWKFGEPARRRAQL